MRLHRLHLKTSAGQKGHEGGTREELVCLCLNQKSPFLAIGWSYLYNNYSIDSFYDYLQAYYAAENKKSTPHCFSKLSIDDLVWTRDLNGVYYLCRIIDAPKHFENESDRLRLDIGAIIRVELLKVGLSVPGAIVSRFYSTNGRQPALQAINNEKMLEYSKMIYNQLSGKIYYELLNTQYDIFEMLDAWDLEELVVNYLQIKYDYYLSKNSITKHDSTIKIECELFPRSKQVTKSAVVQVKVKRDAEQPWDYYDDYYFKENKDVFIFYANEDYSGYKNEIKTISRKDLMDFISMYKKILPFSIQKWCDLCKL